MNYECAVTMGIRMSIITESLYCVGAVTDDDWTFFKATDQPPNGVDRATLVWVWKYGVLDKYAKQHKKNWARYIKSLKNAR